MCSVSPSSVHKFSKIEWSAAINEILKASNLPYIVPIIDTMFIAYNRIWRWVITSISLGIVVLILWNTNVFFKNFKAEERAKMTIWANAYQELLASDINDNRNLDIVLSIMTSNKTTPMILADVDGTLSSNNLPSDWSENQTELKKLIPKFKKENQPIEVVIDGKVIQTIYYGNAPILTKLQYYPLALLLIVLLFLALVFFFNRSAQIAQQNKLWTGMAKETAHQIGTPLSALMGWVELLKAREDKTLPLAEMTQDIDRLHTITERFSQIGAKPKLSPINIVSITQETVAYHQKRQSSLVSLKFKSDAQKLMVMINPQLYGWTIENLIKNGIDAMKGKGSIHIEMRRNANTVEILVKDQGAGIAKNKFKKIFEAGYTSKARGWGLGLSLAKRIIEDYHGGNIKVLHSELGVGTTFSIKLNLV